MYDKILQLRRLLQALNDGGRWRFDSEGEPFPFEETEAYQARRIRDRFTPEMLVRYCKALGIDLANPDFYRGRAAIVTRQDWIDKGCPGLTLNEARDKRGLPPSPVGDTPRGAPPEKPRQDPPTDEEIDRIVRRHVWPFPGTPFPIVRLDPGKKRPRRK